MSPSRPILRTVSLLLHPLPRRVHSTTTSTSSVSASEVSHFSSLASSWWDPMGPSRVLHLMNPLRHDFIASCLADAPPENTPKPGTPANTLHYLDIGCGGGIFAESLARTIPLPESKMEIEMETVTRAASITAIDPTSTLIQIARDHARKDPKVSAHLGAGRFRYVNCTLEDVIDQTNSSQNKTPGADGSAAAGPAGELVKRPEGFDMITLFEVLEHIDTNASISPLSFLTDCLRLLKPGGWLIGSTIARTWPSFLVNQVIAEAPWPIGVVPRGTHEWSKFVNPDELEGWASEGLMRCEDLNTLRSGSEALRGMRWKCAGVVYFPGLGWKFVPGSESWGNYFWAIRKGL